MRCIHSENTLSFPPFCFLTPPQQALEPEMRAPREDLTGYAAIDKIQRRKLRARVYSNSARERSGSLMEQVQRDVQALNPFRILVEQAPHIVLALSNDLHGRILYAHYAARTVLHMHVASLLRRFSIMGIE